MIKDDNYYNLLSFEEVASRIKELSDDEKVELQDDVMMAMQLREIPIKKISFDSDFRNSFKRAVSGRTESTVV